MSDSLLLEIGTEEIPARMLPQAAKDLRSLLLDLLARNFLGPASATAYYTPRRLAVIVEGVPQRQPDREEVIMGPPVVTAYDSQGRPTQACLGFAKKQGVSPEDLIRAQGPKGEVVAVRKRILGLKAVDVLSRCLPEALSALTFPKSMYWDGHRGPFIRPIQWICCLYGTEVVPFEFCGVLSGRTSRGHRFMAPHPFEVPHPSRYLEALAERFVIVNPLERRRLIEQAMAEVEAKSGHRFARNSELLEEVSDLVEYPVLAVGSFDPSFLSLPREVLVTSMASHQRYFAMEDSFGNLVPFFGLVSNTKARDMATVIRGNERVLAARLYDARFFYQQDLKMGLSKMAERLSERLFLKGAGDMAEKASRIRELAMAISEALGLDDWTKRLVARAATLCKADLMSQMVGEFPQLQGVMGGYYALAQGEPNEVAEGIREHYKPAFAGDEPPKTLVGAIVSVADRIDTITCCFEVGAEPSGSKDPMGLRRQGIGLLRILIERAWPSVTPKSLLLFVRDEGLKRRILDFLAERFLGILTADYNVPTDFAKAVLARHDEVPPFIIVARAVALRDYGASASDFRDFLETVFKRVFNILRQADEQEPSWLNEALSKGLLHSDQDYRPSLCHELEQAVESARLSALEAYKVAEKGERWSDFLVALHNLRDPLARFFGSGSDGLPVIIEKDPNKRLQRLSLLRRVMDLFEWYGDFSLISSR